MPPWFLIDSAIIMAVLMVVALTIYSITAPISIPSQTIVQEVSIVKRNPETSEITPQDRGYFAIVTVPKSMRVDDTTKVEATIFVGAGQNEIENLRRIARDAKSAIGSDAGFDEPSAAAGRTMVGDNENRQADVHALSLMNITAHLIAPSFQIRTNTLEEQEISYNYPGHWQWTVQALDIGHRALAVAAEVAFDGERHPRYLSAASSDVTVRAIPVPLLKYAAERFRSTIIIAEIASWLWLILIFPALIFSYGLWKWLREAYPNDGASRS